MAKSVRKMATPEDLYKGAYVYYDSGKTGVVTDTFASIDEYWINDEKTQAPIRDEDGAKRTFKSHELQIACEVIEPEPKKHKPSASRKAAAKPPEPTQAPKSKAAKPQAAKAQAPKLLAPRRLANEGASQARVLLFGGDEHMLSILKNFGEPDVSMRKNVQMLLALQCELCHCSETCSQFDPGRRDMCKLDCPGLKLAVEGIEDNVLDLARSLRPDILVGVRPFQIKQAYEQLGKVTMQKLAGLYCLSAVTLPYGQREIEASTDTLERWLMEEVRCQIDLGASAEGFLEEGDASLEEVAQRALEASCGISLSEELWSDATQHKLRQLLGVDMPLKIWDGSETKIFVLLLPQIAKCEQAKGRPVLNFSLPAAWSKASEPAAEPAAGTAQAKLKTTADWRAEQDQFQDMPKLPKDWIRVKSKTGKVYYWNARKKESTYELPLPEGWTKQVSKTNGRTYYFNAKKRKSVFDRPTDED